LAQSAPHFFASFLPLQVLDDVSALHAEHAAFFFPSAFLALHPQVSHAKAEEPAINKAIAAILIILFMV